MGTKLAKNSYIQTGLLQELSNDWSLLANQSTTQYLTQSTTSLNNMSTDDTNIYTDNTSTNTTPHLSSVDTSQHTSLRLDSSSSEISPSSRLSDWSTDESFDITIELEDNELARSFHSLQQSIQSNNMIANILDRRHSNIDCIDEEIYDDIHDNKLNNTYNVPYINATQRQSSIPMVSTPPTPAQRQRSASNYEDALRSLSLDSLQYNLDNSTNDSVLNNDNNNDSVVSKLMNWIKTRVSSIFGDDDIDELEDQNIQHAVQQHTHDIQLQSNTKSTGLTLLQRIQAKSESMQKLHDNGTYTQLALGVAAILIALVLCKRYSPILYERLVRMLHTRTSIITATDNT